MKIVKKFTVTTDWPEFDEKLKEYKRNPHKDGRFIYVGNYVGEQKKKVGKEDYNYKKAEFNPQDVFKWTIRKLEDGRTISAEKDRIFSERDIVDYMARKTVLDKNLITTKINATLQKIAKNTNLTDQRLEEPKSEEYLNNYKLG